MSLTKLTSVPSSYSRAQPPMMNTIAPKNVMNLGVTTEMNRANENIKEKRPMFWEMTTVNINA